ncbi:MAG TPA: matrixin family metalloprotease, partial [Vicinamibacterales bacterium]|nr:matrixin family metalloprotease [Vicinamibacterales bacterium]
MRVALRARMLHRLNRTMVVLLAAVALAETAAAQPPLRLKSRTFVPVRNVAGGRALAAPRIRPSSARRHLLIQFESRVTPAMLAALRAAGAMPLRAVPEHAVAVVAPSGFDPASVGGIRWTGALEPDDKVSADTRRDLERAAPRHAFTVVEFHPDTPASRVQAVVLAAGASPSAVPGLPSYMTLVPTDARTIAALARADETAWMYPASDALLNGERVAICQGLSSDGAPVANYATEGDGWDGPGRNAVSLGYDFVRASSDLAASIQATELSRAMAEWARYIVLDWHQVNDEFANRSVTFMWAPPDHGDGFAFDSTTLAHAFFPAPSAAESLAGDVHFNDTFDWGASQAGRYDVFSVALHELGHSLGLNHSSDPASVMYPSYTGIVSGLAPVDIETIETLYAPRAGNTVPAGWTGGDIGGSTPAGSVKSGAGLITVAGGGADVWGTADAFTYASRPLAGDGDIVARVDRLQYADRWSKAGVMLRSGRTASAAYAFMLVSGEKGLAFQYRTASGQMAAHTDGGESRAPVWLKLSRRGGTVTAYTRTDTTSWRFVGLVSIPFGGTVQAGLAVTSHNTGALATATFSNVSVRPVAAFTSADIGAVGVAGQFSAEGSTLTVTGAGAD